jgi:hypothetical protein
MLGLGQAGMKRATLGFVVAALVVAVGLTRTAESGEAGLVEVKLGLNSISKTERETLWRRVDEYATVDALLDFCGKKLNLQRRTWVAVAPCVEVSSLRKVAAVFRAKKSTYVKAWEEAFADPEKKKTLCEAQKPKLTEYTRILDAHISEAATMCSACLFC